MSEIDKVLQMLADHFGHNEHDVHDLVSKRHKYATKGAVLEDMKNIKPIEPDYSRDLVITAPSGDMYSDYNLVDLANSLRDNSYSYDTRTPVDTYDPGEIIVTAPKAKAPPPPPPFNPLTARVDVPDLSLVDNYDPNDIVVTAKKPLEPKSSPPVWIGPVLPTITDVTDVLTKDPPFDPSRPVNTSLDTSADLFNNTDNTTSGRVPASTSSTYVPGSVNALTGPALTYNPAAFSTGNLLGTAAGLPANYKPLQAMSLPNYANVYDMLFQGQGPSGDMGQSMLMPSDQQPSRLDAAMAAAQQAQEQAPKQETSQSNAGTGKARGGSVNDAIDGVIAYLQSIRR